MKVLWLATSPSLFKEEVVMGWIGSLEHVFHTHCPEIELGIAFEYSDNSFKVEKNGVTYYPINLQLTRQDVLKMKFNGNDNWYLKKPRLLKVIEDFKPDVIHCFGSEWNWGLISTETTVPMVIHMQGFVNIYHDSNAKIHHKPFSLLHNIRHPRQVLQRRFLKLYDRHRAATERTIMKNCHHFMGRTEWDRNIVKYFSPGSTYYHCPEAIRPAIYDAPERWAYKPDTTINIVTIASAGNLKGNGIILETARLLTEMGIDFRWRVSGSKEVFSLFEHTTGIRSRDVNVELLGYIGVERVKQELLDAEMFVLPSIMDNSPNSLCEAQLMGTPVIASYIGGIPQMVQNGVTGILYPYNEPHTLAYTILNLHNSPRQLVGLSQNEWAMAHERHDPRAIARRHCEIYHDIINNH